MSIAILDPPDGDGDRIAITSTAAARILTQRIGQRIRPEKVMGWLESGLLTDLSTEATPRLRVDLVEVTALAARLHAVTSAIPHLAYRVSVNGLRADLVTNDDGTLWRTHTGLDYRAELSKAMRRRAYVGVWPAKRALADRLVENRAWLLPSDAGAVSKRFVREIVGWRQLGGRVAFITAPAGRDLTAWIGSGRLLRIPRGPISAIAA